MGASKQRNRGELIAEILGEPVEFQLRERCKQTRRPLTESEQRWYSPGDRDWRQELVATGTFTFEIKMWQWFAGPQRQWTESDTSAMENQFPDILTTLIAAGPLLVQRRKEKEAAERERRAAEQRRYEEERRRKRDANQWRPMEADATLVIDGRRVAEWIAWAEEWLARADPTARGVPNLFAKIAEVQDWTSFG